MPADGLVMVYKLDQVLRSDLVMRFFPASASSRRFHRLLAAPPGRSQFLSSTWSQEGAAGTQNLTLTVNPDTYLVEKLEFSNALGGEPASLSPR